MGTCTKYTKNMGTCLYIMPIDNSMGTCYDVITNKTTEQHSNTAKSENDEAKAYRRH